MRMTRFRTGLPIAFVGTFLLSLVVPAASVSLGLPATGALLAAPQVVATTPPPATAEVSTKVLTIDDYARWRSIGQASLSPDGRWVTYAYSQREVDDSLFIKALEGGDPHIVVRGGNATFSPDSRWVAYYVNPQDSLRGRRGRGAGAAPGGGRGGRGGGSSVARALELLDLETEARRRWENVQAFEFAEAGGALIVKKRAVDSDAEHDGTDLIVRYLTEGVEELLAYVNEFALDEPGGRLAYTVDGPEGEANSVHLLDLASRMRSVLDAEREAEYRRLTWGDEEDEPSADALAVLKGAEDEDLVERENALLMWPAISESQEPVVLDPRPVEKDDESDEASNDLDEDGDGTSVPPSNPAVNGFPAGWVLSERGALRWATDASRLFVATKPQLPAPKTLCTPEEDESEGRRGGGRGGSGSGEAAEGDTGSDASSGDASTSPKIVNLASRLAADGRPLGPEEVLEGTCPEFVADVDIWHVDDERIQSVQMVRANRDRGRTYQGVVHVEGSGSAATPRYVQLADETMESIQISDDGRWGMGSDNRSYRSDWLPGYSDYFRVDIETGERSPVLERHLRTLGFSPDGEHYLYWKDADIWSYRVKSEEHVNLTANAPVTFENEQFDRFGEKPPHGIAGWTDDFESVILQHRYDLYLQPLEGGEPTNLTQGVGAEREIRFRIQDLDPEEDEIDLDGPLYLTTYGQWTKKAGFYRLENGRLEELVMADARFGNPRKAKDADVVLYTRQDFETFPDYYVSGLDFQDAVKITDANPQQSEYNWGRRILFDYETHDGVKLQGTLAVPNDYQPGERRPMLINFYEKLSQNLHSYPTPRYASSPNFAGYVSAGYLVMQPDIHYRTGPSHQQMLESIDLAIDKVIELGYVDPDRIGLHGHSYSGQGAAYISTHSDRFAAIVAGAAASNLVSDFNQLWKSAGTSQHRYDTYGQGRFATNPYDDFELFVQQSAAQNADQMNTPLLLLHGTEDGSVEWLQAVEFYNGLRWNGKNVILLSYPGEGHGLRQYENQKDFQIRMRQFFDHHLFDRPAPRWMEVGRTSIQKERDREMMDRDGNGNGGRGGGGGQ